jgi:transcription initiation factor IIF auxiliary subunit
MPPAQLRLQQSAEYEGDDAWSWAVWIEGPEQELDRIDYVEYTLHPTFPKPVRRIGDRSTRFKLETGGWGTFTIYATVMHKDGSTGPRLEHELELSYPDGHATTA